MKLLFDFISIQGSINGGAEYAKRVLQELYKRHKRIELFALFDSKIPFVGNDRQTYRSYFIKWIDVQENTIAKWCETNHIELFFVNIAQRYFRYNLEGIRCRTIMVIHDLVGFERYKSKIPVKQSSLMKSISYYMKRILWNTGIYRSWKNGYDQELFIKHQRFFSSENVEIVTVSNYSKYSLLYNIPYLQEKKINVFYSPLRASSLPIELSEIKHLVDNNVPYFVGLNADRYNKNVKMAIDVMERINELFPEYRIVTTGGTKSYYKNHISLPLVNDGELAYILSHAQALLYPTLIEGFGYPPLEAMRYGTPVICSNVSSLPEIVGDAAISFNPLYASELYKAIIEFLNSDIQTFKKKSIKQYYKICSKQTEDLRLLIEKMFQTTNTVIVNN